MNATRKNVISPLADAVMRVLDAQRRGGFNPTSLFVGGFQGAWYDSSDMSTLFQDSAGTTPVTATGQTVRRIADKSGNGNHATNSTGWVLQQDAQGCYYLQTDGVSAFVAAITTLTNYPLTLVAAAKSDVATNGLNIISVRGSDASYKSLYNFSSSQWAVNDRNAAQNATTESVGTNATSHVGVGIFNTTAVNLIMDGIDANASVANANAFGSLNEIYIGKTFSAGNYYNGRFYSALAINRLFTTVERKRTERYFAINSGRQYDVLNGYIAEGDSITQGYSATSQNGYVQQLINTAPRLPMSFVQAVSGDTLTTLEGRLSTTSANCAAIIASGMQPIVSVMVGMNDKTEITSNPSAYFARIEAYAATVRGYGAKFVACTVSASDPATYVAFESTGRPALNALIKAGSPQFDAICDFTTDSRINVWSGTYYADGQHPNDAGHALMVPILSSAIASVRKSNV